jgi:hypothetical protein
MKYVLSIDSKTVLLSAKQVESIANLLDGVEAVKSEYVGAGKGEDGGSYVTVLDRPKLMDLLSLKLMSDTEYNALVTFTEVHKANKDK